MKKCDENISKLQIENQQKELEYVQKQRTLKILKEKAKRIENHVNSVKKYKEFLEKVKDENVDQYGESKEGISAIIDRHKTLQEL